MLSVCSRIRENVGTHCLELCVSFFGFEGSGRHETVTLFSLNHRNYQCLLDAH